jgi:hypothetical protein
MQSMVEGPNSIASVIERSAPPQETCDLLASFAAR